MKSIKEYIESPLNSYYVTPEMFGAKGDGVVDDTSAITAAHNTGWPIRFTKKYLVNTGWVNINTASKFDGAEFIIGESFSGGHLLRWDSKDNIVISGLKITMRHEFGEPSDDGLLGFRKCTNVLIDSCAIDKNVTHSNVSDNQPIWFKNCSGVTVRNSYIGSVTTVSSGGGNGIWYSVGVTEVATNQSFYNFTVENCRFYGTGDEFIGVWLGGESSGSTGNSIKNVRITDNFINTTDTNLNCSIAIYNSSTSSIANENIENVEISGNYIIGKRIKYSGNIKDFKLIGNRYESSMSSMFLARETANLDGDLTNWCIADNVVESNASRCLDVNSVKHFVIKGNHFNQNLGLITATGNLEVEGNYIVGNDTQDDSGWYSNEFYLPTWSSDSTLRGGAKVSNNTFVNCRFYQCVDTPILVQGNFFSNCDWAIGNSGALEFASNRIVNLTRPFIGYADSQTMSICYCHDNFRRLKDDAGGSQGSDSSIATCGFSTNSRGHCANNVIANTYNQVREETWFSN